MDNAAWLSLLMIVGGKSINPMSLSSDDSQLTSQHVNVMALYSASAVDLVTVVCFFVFQDTGDDPSKTQYPDVDFLLVAQLAQSLSQYAVNWAAEVDARSIP